MMAMMMAMMMPAPGQSRKADAAYAARSRWLQCLEKSGTRAGEKADGQPLKAAGDAAAMRASARADWERKECATLGRPRAITHGAQCQGFERAQGV